MALASKSFSEIVTFTRASTAGYYGSDGYYKTAASGVARIDYNPETLAVRGLLIEPQSTNLVLYSEDLRNTAEAGATRPWSQFGDSDTEVALVTTTKFTGVSGSVSKLRCSTTTAVQRQTSQAFAGADNTVYCVSCIVKAAEVSRVRLNFSTKALTYPNVDFNLLTGSVVFTSGTLVAYGIEVLRDGYYRCWLSANTLTGAGAPAVTIQLMSTAGGNYTGAIGDGLLVDAVQAELGTYPTSYIPTTTAQVTRIVDRAEVTNLSPWYNQNAGTVLVEAVRTTIPAPASGWGAYGRFFTVNDGTVNNQYSCGTVAGQSAVYTAITAAGVETMNYAALNMTANAVTKCALALTATSARMAINGALAGASDDTSVIMPTATRLTIGGRSDGSQETAWSGWIRSVRYYPRRVTNAELVSLTT